MARELPTDPALRVGSTPYRGYMWCKDLGKVGVKIWDGFLPGIAGKIAWSDEESREFTPLFILWCIFTSQAKGLELQGKSTVVPNLHYIGLFV
jgi:hypothetical protein